MKTAPVLNLLPKNFPKRNFMGSDFQNSETETIAENLVFIQNKMNPEKWTPFSFEDYKRFCKHDVSSAELGVLEALVKGGKPVWNTTTLLDPGYLIKDKEGKYNVTEKFLRVISKFAK